MADFTLDQDALLTAVNNVAKTITGIRQAFNYRDWPQNPPGIPVLGQAYHFTGFPPDEGRSSYQFSGQDLSQYIIPIPMYCVVSAGANPNRARQWITPYLSRYPETFRDHGRLSVAGVPFFPAGSVFDQPLTWNAVDNVPGYDAFKGFYIIRFVLTALIKGAHINSQ